MPTVLEAPLEAADAIDLSGDEQVMIAIHVANDGESNWFEGVQLLAVYVVLAIVFFFI